MTWLLRIRRIGRANTAARFESQHDYQINRATHDTAPSPTAGSPLHSGGVARGALRRHLRALIDAHEHPSLAPRQAQPRTHEKTTGATATSIHCRPGGSTIQGRHWNELLSEWLRDFFFALSFDMCGYQRDPLIIMAKQKCCNKNRVARKHWPKASRTTRSTLNGIAPPSSTFTAVTLAVMCSASDAGVLKVVASSCAISPIGCRHAAAK